MRTYSLVLSPKCIMSLSRSSRYRLLGISSLFSFVPLADSRSIRYGLTLPNLSPNSFLFSIHRNCMTACCLLTLGCSAGHPSDSKQHAVIQFRWIEKRNEFGDKLGRVRPYLIDLESANGTKLNKELIPSSRYLELRDKDMIHFGDSTREYVLMLPPKD